MPPSGNPNDGPSTASRRASTGLLPLPVFVIFGDLLPIAEWLQNPRVLALRGGVLVVRRIPMVMLLRRPLALDLRSATWQGWFGPMRVASIFYLLRAHEAGGPDDLWVLSSAVVTASPASTPWMCRQWRSGRMTPPDGRMPV